MCIAACAWPLHCLASALHHTLYAGLASAVLGLPLDKTQQCSAWHLRPLTDAQKAYAAADAAVLLAIFDALLAAAPAGLQPATCSQPVAQATDQVDRHSVEQQSCNTGAVSPCLPASSCAATAHDQQQQPRAEIKDGTVNGYGAGSKLQEANGAGAAIECAVGKYSGHMQQAQSTQLRSARLAAWLPLVRRQHKSTCGAAAASASPRSVPIAAAQLDDSLPESDCSVCAGEDGTHSDASSVENDAGTEWWPLSAHFLEVQDMEANLASDLSSRPWSFAAVKQRFAGSLEMMDGKCVVQGGCAEAVRVRTNVQLRQAGCRRSATLRHLTASDFWKPGPLAAVDTDPHAAF